MNNQNIIHYKNTKLKKIINVYQEKYKNGSAQGFGDFLNGCFCLLQICIKFNMIFDIDISNHPISKYFIKNNENKKDDVNYKDIIFYRIEDSIRINKLKCYNNLIKYLNTIDSEVLYIFCNLDPFYPVQDFGRNTIQQKLIPTIEIDENIKEIFKKFNLKYKEYEIIHIRTGDKYLLNKNKCISEKEIYNYKQMILSNTFSTKKYIIISDNMYLKKNINLGNNFYIIDNEISHTGENIEQTDECLKSTIIDFFLMNKASKIISISLKTRGGTGFSRLCSVLFNIPYKNLLIDMGFHLY
jgi:hypothetical protein